MRHSYAYSWYYAKGNRYIFQLCIFPVYLGSQLRNPRQQFGNCKYIATAAPPCLGQSSNKLNKTIALSSATIILMGVVRVRASMAMDAICSRMEDRALCDNCTDKEKVSGCGYSVQWRLIELINPGFTSAGFVVLRKDLLKV